MKRICEGTPDWSQGFLALVLAMHDCQIKFRVKVRAMASTPINLRVNLCRPPLAPFGPLLNFDGSNPL